MIGIIEQNMEKLADLCRRHHVAVLDVFGSAASGEFDEQRSDIDLLVEFDETLTTNRFDNFFELLEELKQLFNRPIDLVEPGGLRNPYFIDSVNRTRKRIYAAS
jgi:predicted nucleotidyltransferase